MTREETSPPLSENQHAGGDFGADRKVDYTEKLAQRLSLISEIARTTLSKLEVGDLLNSIVKAIHEHFGYFDVSIFLIDPDAKQCVLVAQSGSFPVQNVEGYRQEIGAGIVGLAAQRGKTLLVNDTREDPNHIVAFPGEEQSLSELAVPILLHDHTVGVINIENQEANAFDECDAMAIETLAEQVAQAIANAQLFEHTRLLRDLNRSIIDAMPSGLCALDDRMTVLYINPACAAMFAINEKTAIGEHVKKALPESLLKNTGIGAAIDNAFAKSDLQAFTDVSFSSGDTEKILNVRVTPAQMPEGIGVLLMFEDVTEWRKAMALAEQRLHHIELIVSHVPVAVISWDMTGTFTFWGTGATNLLGYTLDEIRGKKLPADIFGSPAKLRHLLAQCDESAGSEANMLVRRKDGVEVPALVVMGKLQDRTGRHAGYSAVVVDLTERQRAEDNIVREKQKLENVVRVIGAGLALVNHSRDIVWANRTIQEWFGRGRSLEGRSCHEICCPGGSPKANCALEQCFASHARSEVERTLVRADGAARRCHLAFTPVFASSGKIEMVLMLALDVTDHTKKVFQLSRLRQLGELMQGVLELDRLLNFVLTCVTAGQALGFNRAILLLVDRDHNTIVGRMGVGPGSAEEAGQIWRRISEEAVTLEDLLARYDRDPKSWSTMDKIAREITVSLENTEHIITQCALSKQPIIVEDAANDPRVNDDFAKLLGTNEFVLVPLIARNEAVGVVIADNHYSRDPILQENVELLCMFANQAAIAIENAESYQRLEKEKAHLEQAYRDLADAQDKLVRSERLVAIGRMAAHVAHEIRNPLVNIGGFAGAMSRRKEMPREEISRYSDIIASEVRRLESILARVMDFSKPPRPLVRQSNLCSVVKDTLAQLRNRASEQGTEIVTHLIKDPPPIYFDPDQIKQVLLNLFLNALDAMKEGGTLDISVRQDGDNMDVIVRNTGRPIHPEDMANLFEPFFSTKPGGTGLGLTVSQKIIQDHGGDIRAFSAREHGTTFTVSLPLKRTADDSLSYRPSPPRGSRRGR